MNAPAIHSEAPTDAHASAEHGGHPGERTYLWVAALLAVITGVEVWIYNVEAIQPILAPVLLAMSAFKFFMVVSFFMHLKFDNRLFTYMFAFGLGIGTFVVICLMLLFRQLPPAPPHVAPSAPHSSAPAPGAPAPAAGAPAH